MKLKKFEDFQLYVRENDWGFWQNSEYEPEETKLIKSLVNSNDVCVDVGANVGYFTVLMAKRADWVHAYEPEPSNHDLLVRNVFKNKVDDRVVFDYSAVSDRDGELYLWICEKNHGMHRTYRSKHCDYPIKVPCSTLDSLRFSKIPTFIKMDIEGAELGALKGMKNLLTNNDIKMVMEFHPPSIQEYGANAKDEYDFLTNLGYDIRLVPNIDETITYEDLYKETMKEPSGRNILCLKR